MTASPPPAKPTTPSRKRLGRLSTQDREALLHHYLRRILQARVYEVAKETALTEALQLSARMGNRILLKREDTQAVFSFKLRGAYNKMAQLTPAQLRKGVVCASAGNHAQGVALAASHLRCQATVVMPTTTPQLKIEAVRQLGGQAVLHGESYAEAYQHARAIEKKTGGTFVHPFDDPDVIAGQGTVALEILRQHPGPIHAVFVAVGGGGLISGVAACIKAIRPETKVIGVQIDDSDAMTRSVHQGKRVTLHEVGLFSDTTAVKQVGEQTFHLARELVDDFITVNTDTICAGIKDIYQETRSIVEPAGALGVAGIKSWIARHRCKDQTFVAITCGANMNFDRLRFVAERAEVGEEREAVFAVTIPEERGSFLHFCELIGPRSVTEFNYRISDDKAAHIFVGLTTTKAGESTQIAARFNRQGFATLDLTHDELAKQHLRHMVGGRSALAHEELLFRFEFPERPGALMKFLASMHPSWNISLFHYRNQGADYGRILMGIQVARTEKRAFREFLKTLHYPFVEETANPVYRMFLR